MTATDFNLLRCSNRFLRLARRDGFHLGCIHNVKYFFIDRRETLEHNIILGRLVDIHNVHDNIITGDLEGESLSAKFTIHFLELVNHLFLVFLAGALRIQPASQALQVDMPLRACALAGGDQRVHVVLAHRLSLCILAIDAPADTAHRLVAESGHLVGLGCQGTCSIIALLFFKCLLLDNLLLDYLFFEYYLLMVYDPRVALLRLLFVVDVAHSQTDAAQFDDGILLQFDATFRHGLLLGLLGFVEVLDTALVILDHEPQLFLRVTKSSRNIHLILVVDPEAIVALQNAAHLLQLVFYWLRILAREIVKHAAHGDIHPALLRVH